MRYCGGIVFQCETFSIFPVIRWKQYLNYDFAATFIWCRVSRVHFPFSFSFFLLTFQYVCVRFVCLYVQPTLNIKSSDEFHEHSIRILIKTKNLKFLMSTRGNLFSLEMPRNQTCCEWKISSIGHETLHIVSPTQLQVSSFTLISVVVHKHWQLGDQGILCKPSCVFYLPWRHKVTTVPLSHNLTTSDTAEGPVAACSQ